MTADQTPRTKALKALLSLVALALLALTVHSVAFSGASFVDAGANPGNIFSAGTLSHTNSGDGQIIVDADNLRPGGPAIFGDVVLTGGPNLSGLYAVTQLTAPSDLAGPLATPATPGLSTRLWLTIDEVLGGGSTVNRYSGHLSALQSPATATLGTIDWNQARTFRFTLQYRLADADPGLQGASTSAVFTFTGTSQ